MSVSFPLVQLVLTAAVRDRLVMTFLFMLVLATSMATFLGSSAVTEQDQFSLVYAAGSLRFLGVMCLVLFISFYIRRGFEHKEVEFLLSRPISRLNFILSHSLAFAILAIGIALITSIIILLSATPDLYGWSIWSLSFIIECILISMIAMFFAMVLSSAAGAALACFGFYVLARMMGVILGISNLPTSDIVDSFLGTIVEIISVFIPRFDLLAQTSWLVYGQDVLQHFDVDRFASGFTASIVKSITVPIFVLLQGIIFGIFITICTAFDFIRKQF